ncbi:X-Pro dipeptidyl-peptidase protein-like protein [Bisporella sp. PMI_857]|nr:X-Pro dipeptidyl-peptidase protein-like protein [Bisporella sp. PMI_857]
MAHETNKIIDLLEITEDNESGLIFEKNVSIPLKASSLPVRCNVYRPIPQTPNEKFPVLVTYGPYGKDIPYDNFFAKSFSEVNPEHKSKYSAWETPDPVFWTSKGYVIVRCDERGLGQSPGLLDTMSRGTSECFFDVVEWAAEQPWSSGKVGLLGISYYAGSQWRVAARRPKGLAAIIPWEGMTDYYRDRCRHGGIFSDGFIRFWWNRQVITNQYGRPGRAASRWGEDTIEGDLPEEVLAQNRNDQNIDNENNRFLDDPYYASKEFNLEDIEVPVLSVANWGGILLHLRGNVNGYSWAGSKFKYLRFITGRHDLPFYYKEEVEVQKSFLDAFLKDEDTVGWSVPGKVSPVSVILRKGNVGFNNAEAEKAYERRSEKAWPLEGTQYTKFYLTPEKQLQVQSPILNSSVVSYEALGAIQDPKIVQFTSAPFEEDTEITGHVTAHLNISTTPDSQSIDPEKDIDVFLTLRYISPAGTEVFYTGTAGDPVPLSKGWLRVSLRKVATDHPRHSSYQPYREYRSNDVQEVKPDVPYAVDVEIWPTNVVAEKGGRIVLEVSSGDTQGCGIFTHNNEKDRSKAKFSGLNNIHFGDGKENYVTLPIVPRR